MGPFAERLRSNKYYVRGKEMADDLREKWETSDNPMVHRIQDMTDSMFRETETAQAMRVITEREPEFSLPEFVRDIQMDIRPVLEAYLKGNIADIEHLCSEEMLERFNAQVKAWQAGGIIMDNRILDVSDVEVVSLRLLAEDNPAIVLSFMTQQINCVRDKFGNVAEGQEDDIQVREESCEKFHVHHVGIIHIQSAGVSRLLTI